MATEVRAKAIVTKGDTLVEDTVTLPALGPHEILVRVHYAALNPTDGLAFGLQAFGDNAVLGCDFAGIVEKVGSEASRFSIGDRVSSFTWGGEISGVGAYSELCIADERIAFKVPDNVTLEQASTIPLAATTAYLALFSPDCLHLKQDEPPSGPVLVLGGSSTVGSFTNQLATIYGIKTAATASGKNRQQVLNDGATDCFNYHDSDVVDQIKKALPNIDLVFDTIGNPSSSQTAEKILGDRKSKLCTVRPGKAHTDNLSNSVSVHDVFVFTVFLKEHSYRGKAFWPINYENHDLAKKFYQDLSAFVESGKIKPRPVRSLGKLSADTLLEAMELLKSGSISNEKVCFTVVEN